MEDLIKQANEKGKYLVLDLRSNGGGAVNNLQHLLSLLLPPDTVIGSFIGKSLAKRYADETKGDPADVVAIAKWSDRKYKTTKRDVEPFKGKIAVLINRASASASEICAAALKENAKAPLVGARSAGAVLASVYAKLPRASSSSTR
ncbi:MAG: S41 family peptidase [Fimbriimonadales bacterium]